MVPSVRKTMSHGGARHTVDTLLVSESLPLLCLVPFYNQPVPEGQSCSGVGGAIVTR